MAYHRPSVSSSTAEAVLGSTAEVAGAVASTTVSAGAATGGTFGSSDAQVRCRQRSRTSACDVERGSGLPATSTHRSSGEIAIELALRPDPSRRVCSIPLEGPQKARTPSLDALTTAD